VARQTATLSIIATSSITLTRTRRATFCLPLFPTRLFRSTGSASGGESRNPRSGKKEKRKKKRRRKEKPEKRNRWNERSIARKRSSATESPLDSRSRVTQIPRTCHFLSPPLPSPAATHCIAKRRRQLCNHYRVPSMSRVGNHGNIVDTFAGIAWE